MLRAATLVTVLLPCMIRFMAAPAYADHHPIIDRETLYGWCKPYAAGPETVGKLCAGYLFAISDLFTHKISVGGRRACIPEHVTLTQLRGVVFERLENRPKELDAPGYDWVVQAFADSYPCDR